MTEQENERELLSDSEKLVTIQDYIDLLTSLVEVSNVNNSNIREAIDDAARTLKYRVNYVIQASEQYYSVPSRWQLWRKRRRQRRLEKICAKEQTAEQSAHEEESSGQRLVGLEESLKRIESSLQSNLSLSAAPKVPEIAEQSTSDEETSDDVMKF